MGFTLKSFQRAQFCLSECTCAPNQFRLDQALLFFILWCVGNTLEQRLSPIAQSPRSRCRWDVKEMLRLPGMLFEEGCVCAVGAGDGIRLPSALVQGFMPKHVPVYSTILGLPASIKEMVGVLC